MNDNSNAPHMPAQPMAALWNCVKISAEDLRAFNLDRAQLQEMQRQLKEMLPDEVTPLRNQVDRLQDALTACQTENANLREANTVLAQKLADALACNTRDWTTPAPDLVKTLYAFYQEGYNGFHASAGNRYAGNSVAHSLSSTGWLAAELRHALDIAKRRIVELEAATPVSAELSATAPSAEQLAAFNDALVSFGEACKHGGLRDSMQRWQTVVQLYTER